MEELEALMILTHIPLIGATKIRFLIQYYGSAKAALNASPIEIATFRGFGPKIIESWNLGLNEERWKKNLQLAERFQVQLIPFTSPDYPQRLLEIDDFPLILYVQGKLIEQDQQCLAIVGTRQATIYGLEMARLLSRQLTEAGYTIVSGLARGIDTAAHEGAIESGRTLAVLGSGLASIYPSENKNLAAAIQHKGAVLSEFSMETSPEKQNFPKRNRIVSGMTLGTILIEAPEKSGAMLTANLALSHGRPVFALPGRADHDSFRGNHALVKTGKAALIENVQDILKEFANHPLKLTLNPSLSTTQLINNEEKELLKKMPTQEISIEELVTKVEYSIGKLNGLLMSLVLKKMVKEYPGKIYKKYRESLFD